MQRPDQNVVAQAAGVANPDLDKIAQNDEIAAVTSCMRLQAVSR
jgi:hypothetical protein